MATQKQTQDLSKIPTFNIRALVLPNTINEEQQTVDVVFATDNRILRTTYWGERFYETLSMNPSHVRMGRMENGAPLLDNHMRYGKTGDVQLGVVTEASLETNRALATLKFSQREYPQEIYQDIKDGVVRNFSVGYFVYKYEHTINEDGPDEYVAVDWEPFEVSSTPVNADPDAQARSADGNYIFRDSIIIHKNPRTMEESTVNGQNASQTTESGAESTRTLETTPAAVPESPATPPADQQQRSVSTPQAPDQEAITAAAQAAVALERTRTFEITNAARIAGVSTEFANDLIQRGLSLDQARAEIFTEWQSQGGANQRSFNTARLTGEGERDKQNNSIEHALSVRADSNYQIPEDYTQLVRKYRNLNMLELARRYLNDLGINTDGMSKFEIAKNALQGRAYHSSSDFPIILGNTINRTLRRAYQEAERTFTPWCRRTNLTDFREVTRVQLSELLGSLDNVVEGGEYKTATFTEGKEVYKLAKYGRIIPFTWEALINDDLDAFSRVPTAFANKAAHKQSDIVYGILTGSHLMGDGNELFDTSNHGNLAASGSAISVASLSAARAAMLKQKGLGKEDFINVRPSYLIVGPDKELEAAQFTSVNYVPDTPGNINPSFNTNLTPISEPRVTGNQWYLAARPGAIDTIEYAFLEGEQEIFTERKESFNVDGVMLKVRMVFAAKAIDWRGFYKNPGA